MPGPSMLYILYKMSLFLDTLTDGDCSRLLDEYLKTTFTTKIDICLLMSFFALPLKSISAPGHVHTPVFSPLFTAVTQIYYISTT